MENEKEKELIELLKKIMINPASWIHKKNESPRFNNKSPYEVWLENPDEIHNMVNDILFGCF